jgi:ribosomal RNA-processing protein 9
MYFLVLITPHLFFKFDFSVKTPSLRTGKHRLSLTSATATESGSYLFTSGKEGCIMKWDLSTGRRLHTFHKHRRNTAKASGMASQEVKSHSDQVLALAVSGDEKYLVGAGKDRKIGVWDVEKNEWVKAFGGHRDTISVSSLFFIRHLIFPSETFVRAQGVSIPERHQSIVHRFF